MNKLLLLLLLALPVCVSAVNVSSEFVPKILSVGNLGRYSLIVSGTKDEPASALEVPPGLELNVDYSTQSFKVDPETGKMDILISYNYSVTSQKPGIYTIDKYAVDVAGLSFTVPSTQIEVLSLKDYKHYMSAKKEALKGNAYAQHALALIFYYGKGVRKDAVEAYGWFAVAAKRNQEASNMLYTMQRELSTALIKEGEKRAEKIKKEIRFEKYGK